ncbi:zinc finger protein 300-like [Musca vetustissima]|uniref:zinc finger protein 300-like n=1 Tax=Musca vetustissima TaxID=27455 RepID=UPI002AB72C26|nr:zinc finger protein 300-like [Musca vetustissima]
MEEQPICRICMQNSLLLDWNIPDPLPKYLCEYCSTDLKKVHLFIEKAIAAQAIFLRSTTRSMQYDEHTGEEIESQLHSEDDIIEENIETNLKTDSIEELTKDDNVEYELIEDVEERREATPNLHIENEMILGKDNCGEKALSEDENVDEMLMVPVPNEDQECGDGALIVNRNNEASGKEDFESENNVVSIEPHEANENIVKVAKPKKRPAKPVMCSYCSKIIHDVNYLKRHEQTHQEFREREVTCPKCGYKTYTKQSLRSHMECHNENREKKYKCEFCDKAFFQRGACNIHRRIHLGQCVKCPICSKEFPRQVDVDVHMKSHSGTPLIPIKPRQRKHLVHCKDCDKDVEGRKFYEHRAKHLNQPLARCTLCEKDFFSRKTCTNHMKNVHKRTKDNYEDITMYYEKYRMRLSYKRLVQQEEVIPKTE